MNRPRAQESSVEVHQRSDLDRASVIYSLEFSEAEIQALAQGVVLASVQATIALVLTPVTERR